MVRARHDSAAGHREFLVFEPATKPRGLVMMLHGCAQDPEDFARGTGMNAVAARQGWVVVWPEQSTGDNANGCWNWFRTGHQSRGFGEPAILAGIVEDLILDRRLARARVAVAGFSAGAAMTMVLRETYPDVFRAFASHSGLGTGLARNGVAALSAMRDGREGGGTVDAPFRPTLIVHGTHDDVVSPSNAAQAARRLPGSTLRLIPNLGHAWSGGRPEGSFTAPGFPDITLEIADFFARAMGQSRWLPSLPFAARAS